jgi:hypothetical protein
MNRDRPAMSLRIGSHGRFMSLLIHCLRAGWDSPPAYRPEAHYMRGPGPKWREKHAGKHPRANPLKPGSTGPR